MSFSLSSRYLALDMRADIRIGMGSHQKLQGIDFIGFDFEIDFLLTMLHWVLRHARHCVTIIGYAFLEHRSPDLRSRHFSFVTNGLLWHSYMTFSFGTFH